MTERRQCAFDDLLSSRPLVRVNKLSETSLNLKHKMKGCQVVTFQIKELKQVLRVSDGNPVVMSLVCRMIIGKYNFFIVEVHLVDTAQGAGSAEDRHAHRCRAILT